MWISFSYSVSSFCLGCILPSPSCTSLSDDSCIGCQWLFILHINIICHTYLRIWTKFHHTIEDTRFTAHTRWCPRRANKKPSEWRTILNSAFSFKKEFCSKTTIFFCIDTLLTIFWNLKWWTTKTVRLWLSKTDMYYAHEGLVGGQNMLK